MRKKKLNISDSNWPLVKTLGIVGPKWNMIIIYHINTRTIRYIELKRSISGILENMLSERLKFLCEAGVVARMAYEENPPRVEYSLTPMGLELFNIIEGFAKFGERHNGTFI